MSERGQDLGYVKDVVRRSERSAMPAAILYLWAGISIVGFAINDFTPQSAGLYWLVASVAGFALSGWLGSRHARALGQESREQRWRHLLHWSGMGVAIFLLSLLAGVGSLEDESMGHAIVLVVALSYWLAGVHLVPALKWMGLVAAGVYVGLVLVDGFPFPWTVAGLVLAAGLVVAGRAAGASGGKG